MMVETDSEVVIRPATPADAEAIARVHVESWSSAYAAVLPAEFLASLDTAERAGMWRTVLSRPEVRVLVAEADGRTLGFASFGPSRDEDAEPGDLELYTIYLDPKTWGRGVARDLLRTVLADVPPATPMSLWVLKENQRAQHFYRRHGFHPDGIERIEEIAGKPLTEVRYRRPGDR
jgi:ribosomal protein S18 acetylase RimI-like enzyme